MNLKPVVYSGALAVLALLPPARASAKDLGTFPSQDKAWQISLATLPQVTAAGPADPGIQLNRVLTLVAHMAPANAAKGPPPPLSGAAFDARLPDYNLGMVVRPVVTETAPGDFRIDGVKLHMAGVWELTMRVQAAGAPVIFVVPVKI